jgi:hypothetical protein
LAPSLLQTWRMMGRCALLLLLVAGCGGAARAPVADTGTVSVVFSAQPLPAGALTLASATISMEDLALFGDVQSAPGIMLPGVSIDMLAPSGPVLLDGLPQGVYSRLRFSLEALHISGQWRDHMLLIDLVDGDDDDDVVVDLRAPAGRELTAGQTIGFAVSVDPGAWLAGVDLDQASIDADQCIRLGGGHNSALVPALLAALPPSFQLATPGP